MRQLIASLGGRRLKNWLIGRFTTAIVRSVLDHSQDIDLARRLTALFETAAFVDQHLNAIASSGSPRELMENALSFPRIPGLTLEFGVYRGDSINFIAGQISDPIYGFDSFEGLPEFWRDRFDQGTFAVQALPAVKSHVQLIKGWFSNTLPPFLAAHPEKFSFVHVDCDLYSSTVSIFTLAQDRFQIGTVIVFDEYFNYPGWKFGEYRAFVEFLDRTGFSFEYLGYCRNHEQVVVRLKANQ